ncbi:ParB/RepB/Spo0J family partition protein, partial [Coprococcus comes]|uniref:ParB/RepB/Spo0J family partition protein n=1 Tax=Coprococcus comes TaxID=410072 RepID=UPI00156EEEA6
MTTSGITNINAKLIHQHPDNPRKDLGDLSELSESIKKKGIMQNLTVVPGHWDENRAHHEEGYTLIIGHRRFAAGKMAGVTMYPCRIVQDMSYKDQVGTMLEENMQRIDLTVLEQAEGFQMMLDLGDTEEQIAEKTGFSRTTVHRRLEIAKLDRDLVKEKTDENGAYQLNLKDLAQLSRIEDVETRN